MLLELGGMTNILYHSIMTVSRYLTVFYSPSMSVNMLKYIYAAALNRVSGKNSG